MVSSTSNVTSTPPGIPASGSSDPSQSDTAIAILQQILAALQQIVSKEHDGKGHHGGGHKSEVLGAPTVNTNVPVTQNNQAIAPIPRDNETAPKFPFPSPITA